MGPSRILRVSAPHPPASRHLLREGEDLRRSPIPLRACAPRAFCFSLAEKVDEGRMRGSAGFSDRPTRRPCGVCLLVSRGPAVDSPLSPRFAGTFSREGRRICVDRPIPLRPRPGAFASPLCGEGGRRSDEGEAQGFPDARQGGRCWCLPSLSAAGPAAIGPSSARFAAPSPARGEGICVDRPDPPPGLRPACVCISLAEKVAEGRLRGSAGFPDARQGGRCGVCLPCQPRDGGR